MEVLGKQPNSNIWVFNENVHMNNSGSLIPVRERCFLLSKDGKLPELINVTDNYFGDDKCNCRGSKQS